MKTYTVVGLDDWLSWIFQTLLLFRWTVHACALQHLLCQPADEMKGA